MATVAKRWLEQIASRKDLIKGEHSALSQQPATAHGGERKVGALVNIGVEVHEGDVWWRNGGCCGGG